MFDMCMENSLWDREGYNEQNQNDQEGDQINNYFNKHEDKDPGFLEKSHERDQPDPNNKVNQSSSRGVVQTVLGCMLIKLKFYHVITCKGKNKEVKVLPSVNLIHL